ncbi:MAG: BlaI/MecI/CopY family transcriptional regulator [Candidatus Sumerlaeaceae bacterium]|nr:BlaI/MecI/CopY family transcriptional regulator [Candidatus Sumerlaeaceae bacterium]
MRKKQTPKSMACGAPQPTDAELEILGILWERGPSTVRDVFEALAEAKDVGYTSVLKQLQVMTDKGLVKRDESERVHVFAPQVQKSHYAQDILDRFFGGSVEKLVLQALSGRRASPEDLKALKDLVRQAERKSR